MVSPYDEFRTDGRRSKDSGAIKKTLMHIASNYSVLENDGSGATSRGVFFYVTRHISSLNATREGLEITIPFSRYFPGSILVGFVGPATEQSLAVESYISRMLGFEIVYRKRVFQFFRKTNVFIKNTASGSKQDLHVSANEP